jgi:hypothetical protein
MRLRGVRRAVAFAAALWASSAAAQLQPTVPPELRGRIDAERSGLHDANNIRTIFWNFGMVGDYPADPGGVDLSTFHSVEVPRGTGMNYSDGITPFVLAKIRTVDGQDVYLMETGFRERQALSPRFNRVMRFEPRPGWFEANPDSNPARSPAISNDPRTWPDQWPDKTGDPDDPGWAGSWNGYFGKRPAADQESFFVLDDEFYDAHLYYPDARDSSRHGLGLRVEARGFQWANPQAANVIFWHYDITNEGTVDYIDNVIFGLYMDSGVGGSLLSCDGIFESDDDNAFFDRNAGLNLVYTWDVNGRGRDRRSACSPTGYLGYAYLETPGNPFDGVDNDEDGARDERREGGPGTVIVGQDAIRAHLTSNYDFAKFQSFYGALENRPAYRIGRWWTGDEDLDWDAEFHDVGADGVEDTDDTGEGDGMPTEGEPNFDRTDLNESDQIGLTGFKMNRIRAGVGNPDPTTDGILFYTESNNWPQRLYEKFTDPFAPARFDSALASNYNIGFLFASGPFQLRAGQRERFSLALGYGADLSELRTTVGTVQQIYDANYRFAVPPPTPTLSAETGDGYVRLSWNDVSERAVDPITSEFDFEGYRIYRSTDPDFRDLTLVTTGRGSDFGFKRPTIQFDLANGVRGYSRRAVEGVQYWLGDDTGITHTWTDTTVTNGQQYYYAITSYDRGVDSEYDSLRVYPSENAFSVSRNPRGGIVLPINVVSVRPNPRVLGYRTAEVGNAEHTSGRGIGSVSLQVVNANQVPEDHVFRITFESPGDSVRANRYVVYDTTAGVVCLDRGADFDSTGRGAVGCGLLPFVQTIDEMRIIADSTGLLPGSTTTTRFAVAYNSVFDRNTSRQSYPENIRIEFDSAVRDTSTPTEIFPIPRPARFRVLAGEGANERQLDFVFRDANPPDGFLSRANDRIDILLPRPGVVRPDSQITWRVTVQTAGTNPGPGDVWRMVLERPLTAEDVFYFRTRSERVDAAAGAAAFTQAPYVVPNPYIESASFEPSRFNVTGRGDRRMEFRGLPARATIRIYTVRGELVQTLRHDGSDDGFVEWNLRTKDNLDVAPGLFIFQVEAPGAPSHLGKFAIVK